MIPHGREGGTSQSAEIVCAGGQGRAEDRIPGKKYGNSKKTARTEGIQGQQQLVLTRSDLSVQEDSEIGSGHTKLSPSSKHEMGILHLHCHEICI